MTTGKVGKTWGSLLAVGLTAIALVGSATGCASDPGGATDAQASEVIVKEIATEHGRATNVLLLVLNYRPDSSEDPTEPPETLRADDMWFVQSAWRLRDFYTYDYPSFPDSTQLELGGRLSTDAYRLYWDRDAVESQTRDEARALKASQRSGEKHVSLPERAAATGEEISEGQPNVTLWYLNTPNAIEAQLDAYDGPAFDRVVLYGHGSKFGFYACTRRVAAKYCGNGTETLDCCSWGRYGTDLFAQNEYPSNPDYLGNAASPNPDDPAWFEHLSEERRAFARFGAKLGRIVAPNGFIYIGSCYSGARLDWREAIVAGTSDFVEALSCATGRAVYGQSPNTSGHDVNQRVIWLENRQATGLLVEGVPSVVRHGVERYAESYPTARNRFECKTWPTSE